MNGPWVNLESSNFFRAAGLGVRTGRGFDEGNRESAPGVAVVNTTIRGADPAG